MAPQGSPVCDPLETLLEHRDWVRALARSLVADPHRADDVEQETWRMALQKPYAGMNEVLGDDRSAWFVLLWE